MLKNAVFVILSCLLWRVSANQPCLGAPEGKYSFVASPKGCDEYILCMNGQTFASQPCSSGLFEPLSQTCSSSSCMDCSPFGIQNLPHPQACNQYIECLMGQRTFKTCPNGFKFDRKIGYCNNADQVECRGEATTTTTAATTTTTTTTSPDVNPKCGPGQQYHHHPYDCTRFFICLDSILWEQQCPENQHWNRQVNTCQSASSAGCIPANAPTTEPSLIPPSRIH